MCANVRQRTFLVLIALVALAYSSVAATNPASAAPKCKLALVLALDVSGSVDPYEFNLQSKGLADALRLPEIAAAIRFPGNRGIAVTVSQWSGEPHQEQSIPWTLLSDDASLLAFAQRVEDLKRAFRPYSTAIGDALSYSSRLFRINPYKCDRHVIDVSGDGPNNEGAEVEPIRDRVVSTGVTVNGLAILGPREFMATYYREKVTGGSGSFVITANTFEDYPEAIKRKLLREIQPSIVMLEQ